MYILRFLFNTISNVLNNALLQSVLSIKCVFTLKAVIEITIVVFKILNKNSDRKVGNIVRINRKQKINASSTLIFDTNITT